MAALTPKRELEDPDHAFMMQDPIIQVTELPPNMDDDAIKEYFKDRERSDGGEIETIQRHACGREAIIRFVGYVVAARVVARREHSIDGHSITVILLDNGEYIQRQLPPRTQTRLPPAMDASQEEVESRQDPKFVRKRDTSETSTTPEDTKGGHETAVKVTGLPPNLEDEYLTLYFESEAKSGGGKIVKLERRSGGCEAIITFESAEVADRVVARKGQRIKNESITVVLHTGGQETAVKVTGLPPNLEDEYLTLYFESEAKSGGGKIVNLERRSGGCEAIITFENAEVADRVVARKGQRIKNEPITVVLHTGGQETAVKVTGLPPYLDDEYLMLYFESEAKSGGGKIVNLERRSGGHEAVITFESAEVADRVVARKGQRIKNEPITVVLHTGGQETAVKVTGLPPNLEDEYLMLYFESEAKSGGGKIVNLERRSGGHEAVITFESAEVADRVVARKGQIIKNEPITVVLHTGGQETAVKVTGLAPNLDDEYLMLYFESEAKSGGGKIVNLERRSGGHEAVITFENAEVADRVVARKGQRIKNESITVVLYTGGQETAVKVTGLAPNLEDEYLMLYFESEAKSGGGKIVKLERRSVGREAIITFENAEVASRVVARKDQRIKNESVRVVLYTEGCETAVKATGLSQTLEDEHVILYFENESRSGGGSIVKFERRNDGDEAIITFEDMKVADRVVAKKDQRINNEPITTVLYKEEDDSTVKVAGLSPVMEDEYLILFFEDESKSGGGKIVKFVRQNGGREAAITFVYAKIAVRVAGKTDLTIQGQPISVKRYASLDDAMEQILTLKMAKGPPGLSEAAVGQTTTLKVTEVEESSGLTREMFHDDTYWEELRKNDVRIVLIGHTGAGKSATGNTLLNKMYFNARASSKGVTVSTRQENAWRFGNKLIVVDTPGLFDPCMTNEKISKEIAKCIAIAAPGPHAFLMVVTIGRFTKEEHDTVEEFKKIFGPDVMKYMIVLFTRCDDLDEPLSEYVKDPPPGLAELLDACSHRYIGFNNKAPQAEKDKSVKQLLEKISSMLNQNNGSYFTQEHFYKAERAMRRREWDLRMELEDEKRRRFIGIETDFERQSEELRNEHNREMNKLENQLRELEIKRNQDDSNEEVLREIQRLRDEMQWLRDRFERQEGEMKEMGNKKKQEIVIKIEQQKQETREEVRKEVEEETGLTRMVKGAVNTVVGAAEAVGTGINWVTSWFW